MSSSYAASLQAIFDALRELVQGEIGSIRKVPHGAFKYAELLDAPLEERQRIARQVDLGRNWFDFEVFAKRDSEATDFSSLSNRRVVEVDFRFEFIRYVLHRSTIVADVRVDSKIAMHGDLDDVVEALALPNNLRTTVAGAETDIVVVVGQGRAMTPSEQRIVADWENHLLSTEMFATATVEITRSVA